MLDKNGQSGRKHRIEGGIVRMVQITFQCASRHGMKKKEKKGMNPQRKTVGSRILGSRRLTVLVGTLALILSACSGSDPAPRVTENTSWMADIAPAIEDQKLNEIVLPGTHESGTYNISPSSQYADDGNANCRDIANRDIENAIEDWLGSTIAHTVEETLSPLIDTICPRIQAEWSKSQSRSIYDQLTDGIRYIDLRVLSNGEQFQVIHSMVSTDIDTVLGDVKRFYQEASNSKEIVILDINHTYWMTPTLDSQLIAKIHSALTDSSGQTMLIPRCPDGGCSQPMDLTIKNLWGRSASQRVLVFYKDSTGDQSIVAAHPELWYRDGANSKIISNWPNTTSLDSLDAQLFRDAWINQDIRDLQANGGFFGLQTIRTADEEVIKDSITTSIWENGADNVPLAKKIFEHFNWCRNCS
jgi:hypothetical protein